MRSDYDITGRLYQKWDAYMVSQRPESKGVRKYWCSSCQFATRENFRRWLLAQGDYAHLKIIIKKGKE